jgi:group I intron endonuclease
MVGIYRITNKVNNKFYIGQSIDVAYRIKQHTYEAYDPQNLAYDSPLHQDIRKYGWENFNAEVLLECDKGELSQKEQELITAALVLSKDLVYNTRNDYISAKFAQFGLDGRLIKIWHSTKELRESGFDEIGNITKACRGVIRTSVGYMWRFVQSEVEAKGLEKELSAKGENKAGQHRKIIQYDLDTHALIQTFSSGRAAAMSLNKPSGTSPILNTCKGKQRQAYGYGWAYADEFDENFKT